MPKFPESVANGPAPPSSGVLPVGPSELADFMTADRNCRVGRQDRPEVFLRRAELSYQRGFVTYALEDIGFSLKIAPLHRQANSRLVAWGGGVAQCEAARRLITSGCAGHVRDRAIRVLVRDNRALAHVDIINRQIIGWAIWGEDGPLTLRLRWETGSAELLLPSARGTPLRKWLGHAAEWIIPVPDQTAESLKVDVVIGSSIATKSAYFSRPASSSSNSTGSIPVAISSNRVTAVVPVFRDLAATTACLESVETQAARGLDLSVVVVDDASPEPELSTFVGDWVQRHPFARLIKNSINLGFIGAVTKALELISEGDVILLNSDTVLPPAALYRLREAVLSSTNVGTATPLSNNGEFTSFPLPNRANSLPSAEAIKAIDRLAARLNKGIIIDIPSGIGFCLYITRACLDSTGGFSHSVERGYFEDVDFCLRARDRGFRNICVTSVFVGHAGSASFGADKQILVRRNLPGIEELYPFHRTECSAFIIADPLRASREAIERARRASNVETELLIARDGPMLDVLRRRAEQIRTPLRRVIGLEIRSQTGSLQALLRGTDAEEPQSVAFDLDDRSEVRALVRFLRMQRLQRVEFIGPGEIPGVLIDALAALDLAFDVLFADGKISLHHQNLCAEQLERNSRAKNRGAAIFPSCQKFSAAAASVATVDWRIVTQAQHIWAADPMAFAFAQKHFPDVLSAKVVLSAGWSDHADQARRARSLQRIGILLFGQFAADYQLVLELARDLQKKRSSIELIVVGSTLDDAALMTCGNVFVTGKVGEEELRRVIEQYEIDAFLLATRAPIFGHPVAYAVWSSAIPIAQFDWSAGSYVPPRHALLIEHDSPIGVIADRIEHWASPAAA